MIKLTETQLTDLIENDVSRAYGVAVAEATVTQVYRSVVRVVRDILLQQRKNFNHEFKHDNKKRVHYLSMEFLVGRSLKNNLYNLGLDKLVATALSKYKIDIDDIYEQEPDAGLGNGGLGRLAACYMDGLATNNYPVMGHSLRFEYGLFQQKIVDGWQTELPDNWLPGGEIWLTQRSDKACTVKFGGTVKEIWTDAGLRFVCSDYQEVEAMPYDMVMSGYDSKGVAVLRLWNARNKKRFDVTAFSQGEYMRAMEEDAEAEMITKVLYPSDDHIEGKNLRLKQEYFLVSAAMQNITLDHYNTYHTFDNFPELVAVHINDTHPALCVPELMRIFVDEYNLDWNYSWEIVKKVCAYTNHTVMAEALECWSEDIFSKLLPRIYMIVCEINKRSCNIAWDKCKDWQKVSNTSAVAFGQVRMANLSIIGSHSVNGVSELHSSLIKKTVFKDFYDLDPQIFTNVTNGIAHRRWLCQSNPKLSNFIVSLLGDGFIKDADQLKKLNAYAEDTAVLDELGKIKRSNKESFATYLYKKDGIIIDPNTRFDVQVKRLHEYKRQLLNVLKIVSLYHDLKENPDLDVTPQTFIFGAKAAPSYYFAKQIIKLICFISEDLKRNPKIREKLNVVFLENYCVTLAEKLIPSAEISEQISLAGKEASGTGNMKFMINGAITFGTLDGANVEIHDSVGDDNIFIFGHDAKRVADIWAKGYSSTEYYFKNPKLRIIVEELNNGFAGESFTNISNYLLRSNQVADPYMCFADFADYMKTYDRIDKTYADARRWNKMSLVNIAESGRFSADRAIKEYATRIWNLDRND